MNHSSHKKIFYLIGCFLIFLMPFSLFAETENIQTSKCQKDLSFTDWIQDVRIEALNSGASEEAFNKALPYLVLNKDVMTRDKAQGVFQQTFLQFSDRMISDGRIKKATKLIQNTHQDLFAKIKNDFGVPPEPIATLWALESDFGAVTGKYSTLSAVTTLAFDCRRADHFRKQLIYALKLITRGDLTPDIMIGNWAGELGGAQFMYADYLESGVDYDKDGRVNLITSIPDTLASIANYFEKHGWHRDEPWIQEVTIPKTQFPLKEADPNIWHSVAVWKKWHVQAVNGKLASDTSSAALILPMGRLGPAFLVYPNFKVFQSWNSALVYSTTAAYMASRLAGASAVLRGDPNIKPLTTEQVKDLQNLLIKRGYDVGEIDGKVGSATRTAVKTVQIEFNLPADSFPTEELLNNLRN